jgi:hypothetical protein
LLFDVCDAISADAIISPFSMFTRRADVYVDEPPLPPAIC